MPTDEPILVYRGTTSDSYDGGEYLERQTLFSPECPFCHRLCRILTAEWIYDTAEQEDTVAACLNCGWWSFEADQKTSLSGDAYYYSSRAILCSFAVSDDAVPVAELTSYLVRNPERRFDVNPTKLEEVAASIYRDALGFSVEFCSYGRPDRGIDILCSRTDVGYLAIQVKRYKNSIRLAQIREFAGAMLFSGNKAGVFITTGTFQSGCYDAVSAAETVGLRIDLVDGSRLLDFLGLLAHTPTHLSCPDWGRHGYAVNFCPSTQISLEELKSAPIWGRHY